MDGTLKSGKGKSFAQMPIHSTDLPRVDTGGGIWAGGGAVLCQVWTTDTKRHGRL